MDQQKNDRCCCGEPGNSENCVICGKPLVYFRESELRVCAVCHTEKETNAACEDGHFVCDACHAAGGAGILNYLMHSEEKDPIALYLQVCAMEQVHLHGPEHHSMIPCVLLAAFRNCGGEIELEACIREAWKRGTKVPGGSCGFLGVCGAAEGAGIFASLLWDASPLAPDVWGVPQRLTMECLERIVEVGGPRCCKRTGRLAIETAAEFVKTRLGVEMPLSRPSCVYSGRNRECLRQRCPYYGRNA